jgi:hypothetical protein
MRCLLRLGCFGLLIVLGAAAWLTRDQWMARLSGEEPAAATPRWESVTPARASRARVAIETLSSAEGQVFQSLTVGELAAFLADSLGLTRGVMDSLRAAVVEDRILIRGVVRTAALQGALGALSGMMREREPIELAGTLRVVRPGIGELLIVEARVREIPLPRAAFIPLVRQMYRGPRPLGVSEVGVPLRLPPFVGDIRVAYGRVTLYRTIY